jgi:Flp pilus assembly protein TadD
MAEIAEPVSIARRRLIVHDSLAFLSLIAITLVLFAMTLLLFHSFMAHRVDLAGRWADRGRAALAAGQPEQAVAAYRAALSYASGERSYELMLAQSLADAGRTEEAYNYYMELWELHPGDGFLNLQLARLAAKLGARKGETQDAINFYRASLYGTWEGDGVERRRAVRLELARYLIAQRQPGPARVELLVAGGNAPDTPEIDLTLAQLLEQAGAPADALTFYQKTLAEDPENLAALGSAGRIAYAEADYRTAWRLLERAVRKGSKEANDATLLANSTRILELQPADTLPDAERVARILTLRGSAKKRLAGCVAGLPAVPERLQTLEARWSSPDGTIGRGALLRDSDKQAAAVQLAYDTEIAASQPPCPAATGDDALLLRLARSAAQSSTQSGVQSTAQAGVQSGVQEATHR